MYVKFSGHYHLLDNEGVVVLTHWLNNLINNILGARENIK